MKLLRSLAPLALASLALLASGCASLYYDYLEQVGIPKREVLVNRVMDARESQEEAKEQFTDALEEFRSLVSVNDPELEKTYDRLNTEFERSESRADAVRDRISDIRSVAKRLFAEWEDEIEQYTNSSLRQQSEQQLRDTQREYDDLIAAMERVADRMDPVLDAFRDQVLFLKHNLNAAAISSLEGEAAILEQNVSALIADMEASIAEADSFLQRWESTGR